MVIKTKFILLVGFLLIMLAAVGCKESINDIDNDNYDKTNTNTTQKDVVLEFWTWSPIDEIISKFESDNPGIKINTKLLDYFQCKEEYMKALTNGDGPDVLMFYSDMFGLYTVDGVLQDLLEEPFNAEKYQKDFPRWDGGLSIDNKHLLSLTYTTAPQVTLYRTDVMKENGFPYEPEEMAKYLENPDNILSIATKLKQKNKYIFQWPYDLPNVVRFSMGTFDKDLNSIEHGELMNKALDITKTAFKNKMILNGNLWTEEGQEAIKDNQLVMLLDANPYAVNELEKLAPEQKGLWRLTKPSLGMASWQFDNRISINARSKHKEQAWKFIEYLVTHKTDIIYDKHSIPEYLPARQRLKEDYYIDAYLGNQNILNIFNELGNKMIPYKLTPMDEKANGIYGQGIWDAVERGTNSDEDIKKIFQNINKQLGEEKKALLD
ncbi:ABC transporter substrate-binding protein [Pseudobacteroides cellulosolvens]|uniref:ABC transporter substrate-binding protein n=1 Tax=Pseudobacteroides cellulosolvens TaxID=35825 RepID=UPI00068C5AC1|nr:extracellular solute-binding protein [Pseudobacteroides cellulosolvens]